MRRLKGYYVSLLLLYWFAIPSFACLHPVSLSDRVDNAQQIVKGKVISQQSKWDKNRLNIYTIYIVQTSAYLKGNPTTRNIEIILLGGIVQEEAQVMSPSLFLSPNIDYLFYLEEIPSALTEVYNSLSTSHYDRFRLYAYTQGAMPRKDGLYHEIFGKPISESALFNYIKNRTGQDPLFPGGSSPPIYNSEEARLNATRQHASSSRRALVLKNGSGQATSLFYAGTSETAHQLIIEGSGFGSAVGNVTFSNCDDGGDSFIEAASEYETDLISWSDSQIIVKIPQRAGTGSVQVYNSNNELVGSEDITIQWSIKPIYSTYKNFELPTRQFINFTDYDGLGGYTIVYNSTTGLSTNEVAKQAFTRAVDAWRCATGIHWTISEESTIAGANNDEICAILFSQDMPAGVVAMTSSRYKASGSTSCDLFNTTWYLKEFDMQFVHPNSMVAGMEWNFSNNSPASNQFDWETISLHELGHAHGLGHINTPSSSMYFSIENGVLKRTIENQEAAGAIYQMSFSLEENCIQSKLPMKEHSSFCGHNNTQLQQASIKLKLLLEGYYNEATNLMRTDLTDKLLLPTIQPFNVEPFNYNGFEIINNMPTEIVDWILVGIREADNYENVICHKAVLLKSDGSIVDTDGNSTINFDCVSPGSYNLSVTHQNHISVLTNTAITLSDTPILYDFTNSMDAARGTDQLKSIGNQFYLSSGDLNCNGIINNEDYNVWKTKGAALNTYTPADADGNGIINSQDYNQWKANRSKIGLITNH